MNNLTPKPSEPIAATKISNENRTQNHSRNPMLLPTQNFINLSAKPMSTRIMQSVSSEEIDGIIERIKSDIQPLMERFQKQEKRINTLKESLDPHILSTRTAVSHLSHLGSRAKKTSELIEEQSNGFIRLAKNDINQQIDADSVGRLKDFSDTQSDLLGGDQLELARSKLLEANIKLERYIARQRHYERRLATHFSIVRRLVLILLTIKILIDLRIMHQFTEVINEIIPLLEYLSSIFIPIRPNHHQNQNLIDHSASTTTKVGSYHHDNVGNHESQSHKKRVFSDFLAYFFWIILLKLEFF
ncbi:hypothetical protein MJO29_009710 [Puccinia striiformis f. sp. tritici]|nr:hypothetical protein MJO29_009710 [Puccinia striiformis f. sp. tritici]